MADVMPAEDQVLLQDRDLHQRLSWYFDGFESRLRQGQGWFIFNAGGQRSSRITSFIQQRIGESHPTVETWVMPWRDFALNAYVSGVGIPELASDVDLDDRTRRREYDLAIRITQDVQDRLVSTDMLVLVGMKPAHRAEAMLLDQTLDDRHRKRLATIVLTPDLPQELQAEFEAVDPSRVFWNRFFQRMYETNLVAF